MEILKRISQKLVVSLLLLTGSVTAQAALLGLGDDLLLPDVTSTFISTNYDAAFDTFTATGTATSITYDGSTQNALAGGAFELSAIIRDNGIFESGTISIANGSGGFLIQGNLLDFGFSASLMDFVFEPTSGDLDASYVSYTGDLGGIVLSSSGYNGDLFNSDFNQILYNGSANIAPIPVPAALWLFGSGLLALVGIARRRS